MVSSKWIKIFENGFFLKGKDTFDNFIPFEYKLNLYDAWIRYDLATENALCIAMVIAKDNEGPKFISFMYKVFLINKTKSFKESDMLKIKERVKRRVIESDHSIYEVMLRADLMLKECGVTIKDLNYNITGKYV